MFITVGLVREQEHSTTRDSDTRTGSQLVLFCKMAECLAAVWTRNCVCGKELPSSVKTSSVIMAASVKSRLTRGMWRYLRVMTPRSSSGIWTVLSAPKDSLKVIKMRYLSLSGITLCVFLATSQEVSLGGILILERPFFRNNYTTEASRRLHSVAVMKTLSFQADSRMEPSRCLT